LAKEVWEAVPAIEPEVQPVPVVLQQEWKRSDQLRPVFLSMQDEHSTVPAQAQPKNAVQQPE
jgi:hypothetical protein